MKKIILGIETSCDETGVALVEASGGLRWTKFKVLKNLVASQIKIHEPFGGVVPNLAKREHLKNLPILWKRCQVSGVRCQDIDLIAVTVGPGLEPALWTGISFAKQIISNFQFPISKLVGTNHLEGHLYSFLLPRKTRSKFEDRRSKIFPAIALIVSGGHTVLLLMKDLKTWKKLGETRDDAVGEAFDKVARLLKLPYPGGPALEKLARLGNPAAIEFPRPMIHDKNFDFSFSGLKTSVLYFLREYPLGSHLETSPLLKITNADIAASFQKAAIEVLVKKTMRAALEFGAKSVMLSGGVAANKKLRSDMRQAIRKLNSDMRHRTSKLKRNMGYVKSNGRVNFLVAEQKYNTDNAVMIAAAGYMAYLRKKKYPLRANGNLDI
ncbi:MAG: tRNA (adenosine(37)-N6)-threonylcarbamoyltransferase complex transferase subunit TsaD [Candidatus Liptonbacteria bacterium]|nr:tRNA (adenosine(37)-N6)-threonylcarbamoyltransferase complex transferase subunit TsaD [Candidatus Liptonbacteria bacterium]